LILIFRTHSEKQNIFKELKQAQIEEKIDVGEDIEYVKMLINKRNFLLAKKECKKILDKKLNKEDEVEVRFSLALCYVSLKQYQYSKKELEKILKIKAEKRRADTIFLLARLYEDKFKDFKNAKKYYIMYLSKYPDGRLSRIARKKLFELK